MRITSPQHYVAAGHELAVDPLVLEIASKVISQIWSVNPNLFPLLTLNHLSVVSGVDYGFLRNVVARKTGNYRQFLMRKRVPGRRRVRVISMPVPKLKRCQHWIVENILKHAMPSPDSYAYHPNSNPVFAAQRHSNSVWLIKVDIEDFFNSIHEHDVYRVFRSLGYAGILSLELARICTMAAKWRPDTDEQLARYLKNSVAYYCNQWIGILPQGAPTSPMLSNLVMRDVDQRLARLASSSNMRFTRYADDIVFSCSDRRPADKVRSVRNQVLTILNDAGFRPNRRKTVIRGPGDRKLVLGLLVDGKQPRLAKEFKDEIRMHLHYLGHPNFGPAGHATARKTSIAAIYHHVLGLIFWARAVEKNFGSDLLRQFNSIAWPPVSERHYFATVEQQAHRSGA